MYHIPKEQSLTTKPTKPSVPDNSGKLRENLPHHQDSIAQPTSSTSTATSSNETTSSITTTDAMSTVDEMTFNSLVEHSDDIIPVHVFPELSVRDIIHTCSLSKTTVGLFSKTSTDAHFKQRIEEKYFIDVKEPKNALRKYAEFEAVLKLFYEHCLKEIPPPEESLPAQRAIAEKQFQLLKAKILSFDQKDPFFLSWGNYFLSMMYLFGYGIDTAFSNPEAAKKAYLVAGKKHLHAAAQYNNPKAMLILARAHDYFIFCGVNSDIVVFQILEQFGKIIRNNGFGKAINYGHLIDEVPRTPVGADWFQKAMDLEDPEATSISLRFSSADPYSLGIGQLSALEIGVRRKDPYCMTLLTKRKLMNFAKSHLVNDHITELLISSRSRFEVIFGELPTTLFFSQEVISQIQEIIEEGERAALLGSEEAATFLVNFHDFIVSNYVRELKPGLAPDEMKKRQSPLVKLFTDKTNSLRWCELLGRLRADAAESMATLFREGAVLYPAPSEGMVPPKNVKIETEVNLHKTVEWYTFLLSNFLNKVDKDVRKRWFFGLLNLYFNPTLACFDIKKALACGEKGILWGVSECAIYLGGFYFCGGPDGTYVDKNKANYYFSVATNRFQNLSIRDLSSVFSNFLSDNVLNGLRETLRWQLIWLRRNLNSDVVDVAGWENLLSSIANILSKLVDYYFYHMTDFVKSLKSDDKTQITITDGIIRLRDLLKNYTPIETIYAWTLSQVNTSLQLLKLTPFDDRELDYEEPEETSEPIAGISPHSMRF